MKNINKQEILYVVIILILILSVLVFNKKDIEYRGSFNYMDTYISVKITTNNEKKANEALKHIENIYKEYHELTDRYNAYDGINNIYYINNTTEELYQIKLDKRLYDLIAYGKSWYEKSNGIKNINLGNVIDIWKHYQETKDGVPTLEELQAAGSIDINDIVLLDDNYILNNNPNIDLGSVAKGYVTKIAGQYLESIGINNYIINAGGNVIVGYRQSKYKIGIQDPNDSSNIFEVVTGSNLAVVTSGGYERYYEYNNIRYNHIIDPNTLYPANLYKSVTVVTNDSALGDSLSLILFVLPIKEGKEFIKKYNVEAIWYTIDDEIIKSDGFSKYE